MVKLEHFPVLVCIVAVVVFVVGRFGSPVPVPSLQSQVITSEHCHTGSSLNNDVFTAFVTNPKMAEKLLPLLCQNQAINRQFGSVEVRWSHSEQEQIEYIGKGLADFALIKENLMEALHPDRTYGYQALAAYQDYSTYLISLKEKPRIDKQYLWGKKIGLLDYPSSRSGHIVPNQMLKTLGLGEHDVQIHYANSHSMLRQMLAAGKVDVISSYWQEEDKLRFSANYITKIDNNVTGSKWYLKMETHNTDLLCDLQKSLAILSTEMDSSYYNTLKLEPICAT